VLKGFERKGQILTTVWTQSDYVSMIGQISRSQKCSTPEAHRSLVHSQVFSGRELAFTFAVCRRPSACLSSVTFVHPTRVIEIFCSVSTPFNTMVI